jgi:hypothetical protein
MQTIKAVARRRWPDDTTEPRFSWYEALPPGDALTRAVAYVLARPELFLNTTSDARLLPAVFAAAEAVASGDVALPSDDEMAADVRAEGISPLFDGDHLERI